jgi:hypothetical protein
VIQNSQKTEREDGSAKIKEFLSSLIHSYRLKRQFKIINSTNMKKSTLPTTSQQNHVLDKADAAWWHPFAGQHHWLALTANACTTV